MSEVTERHLKLGSWRVDLNDDLPADVRRQLYLTAGAAKSKGYGLLVITPQHVDPADFPPPPDPADTYHPLLGAARYTGVVLDTDQRCTQLTGAGLLALLATDDNIGHFHVPFADKRAQEVASTLVECLIDGGTMTNVLVGGMPGDIVLDPSPLRAGTIHSGGGTQSIGDQLLTTRRWLEDVSSVAGRRSYRVRPTGHVDWGTRAQLWSSFPRVVVGRLPASDDPAWVTVRTQADWSESVADFADQAIADTDDVIGPITTPAPTPAWISAIRMDILERRIQVPLESDETLGDWADRAAEILDEGGRNTSTIASDDLTGIITPDTVLEPGEPIYLWDPEAGLMDADNSITYAGEILRPLARYLAAVTWPVIRGMGVYLLYVDRSFGNVQRILDLTEFVKFSDSREAHLEVGAPAPTL